MRHFSICELDLCFQSNIHIEHSTEGGRGVGKLLHHSNLHYWLWQVLSLSTWLKECEISRFMLLVPHEQSSHHWRRMITSCHFIFTFCILYYKLHSNSLFSPDPYMTNDNRIWAWSKMGYELHIITHISSHSMLNIICATHFWYWCSYKMSFPSGLAGSKLQLFLSSGL